MIKRGRLNKKAESKHILLLYLTFIFIIMFLALNYKPNDQIFGNIVYGPNNPTTVNNVDDPTPNTPAWANLNNVLTPDNTYADANLIGGQNSDFLQVTNFGFNIPNSATINGIKVEIERKLQGCDIGDNEVMLIKNGVKQGNNKKIAGSWSTTESSWPYGGSLQDLWGLTWNPTDINANNFGVSLQVKSDLSCGSTSSTGRVDNIRVTVDYTSNPPTPPSSLTATAFSSSQINLAWTDNSNDEQAFKIERSTDGSTFSQISSVTKDITSYQNTGLNANTQYWYKIRANNTAGDSSYSNTASATTQTGAPTPPSSLIATASSNSQINLVWTDNSNNEQAFKIERSTDGSTFSQISSVTKDITSYQNTGLNANTQYWYKIRANNTAGDSSYSNTASATTQAGADTTNPVVIFDSSMPNDGSSLIANSLNVKVSVVEANFANMTFNLYNLTGKVSSVFSSTSITQTTFNNLPPTTYLYNVNATDQSNNKGSTETRRITLQTNPGAPTVSFISPTPADNFQQTEFFTYINASAVDSSNNINDCTLSLDGTSYSMGIDGAGLSVYCSLGLTALTEGAHTYQVYAKNTLNKVGQTELRTLIIGQVTQENYTNNNCIEGWVCEPWSGCVSNKKTRTCTDSSNCGTSNSKPSEEIVCNSLQIPIKLSVTISKDNKIIHKNESLLSVIKISLPSQEETSINLNYNIYDENGQKISEESDSIKIKGQVTINKWLRAPLKEGAYTLKVLIDAEGDKQEAETSFNTISKSALGKNMTITNIVTAIIVLIIIAIGFVVSITLQINKKENLNSKDTNKKP